MNGLPDRHTFYKITAQKSRAVALQKEPRSGYLLTEELLQWNLELDVHLVPGLDIHPLDQLGDDQVLGADVRFVKALCPGKQLPMRSTALRKKQKYVIVREQFIP